MLKEGVSQISLKILDLGNNAIRRFEDVQVLKELKQLCNVNFQGNPICDTDNYKTTLLDLIPALRILDGQPVEGRHRPKKRRAHASLGDARVDAKRQNAPPVVHETTSAFEKAQQEKKNKAKVEKMEPKTETGLISVVPARRAPAAIDPAAFVVAKEAEIGTGKGPGWQ
jgi:hypothetical protein